MSETNNTWEVWVATQSGYFITCGPTFDSVKEIILEKGDNIVIDDVFWNQKSDAAILVLKSGDPEQYPSTIMCHVHKHTADAT